MAHIARGTDVHRRLPKPFRPIAVQAFPPMRAKKRQRSGRHSPQALLQPEACSPMRGFPRLLAQNDHYPRHCLPKRVTQIAQKFLPVLMPVPWQPDAVVWKACRATPSTAIQAYPCVMLLLTRREAQSDPVQAD